LAKRDCRSGFVLDGYPRRQAQLRHLREHLSEAGIEDGRVVAFYIHVSDKEIRQRVGGRLVCDCGASYHLRRNPPKRKGVCDLCGQRLARRSDDAPATVSKRLKEYHHRLMPIYRYFQKKHHLVRIAGEADIKKIRKDIAGEYKKIKNQ
jgi:adenylate kinase